MSKETIFDALAFFCGVVVFVVLSVNGHPKLAMFAGVFSIVFLYQIRKFFNRKGINKERYFMFSIDKLKHGTIRERLKCVLVLMAVLFLMSTIVGAGLTTGSKMASSMLPHKSYRLSTP